VSDFTSTIPEQVESFGRALTAADLSKILAVNKLTIYRLAQRGTLPHFRVGATCIRFDPRTTADYLREHEVRQ
jgi:excisionase family DNA binding protein